MDLWGELLTLMGGEESLRLWFVLFLASGLIAGIVTGFFKARKIQPKGFKWKTFRNEGIFAAINLVASGFLIGAPMAWLTTNGYIAVDKGPFDWWRIALEYALYFFLFDTWFYCTRSRCTHTSTNSTISQPRPTC
jgi:Delta7-sterol 5-desaturase